MGRPPNYNQERADRNRAKDRKKAERLQRRMEDADKRKATREGADVPDASLPIDRPEEKT